MINSNSIYRFLCVTGLFLLIYIGIQSCKPANERSCFKSSGEMDSLLVELPHFNKLILGEYMSYVLIQDTIEKLRIHGRENLLNQINFNSNPALSQLRIDNDNQCRFLRYKTNDILVYIHFINLNELIFNGSESLFNQGVLDFDTIRIRTQGAAGSINLNVDANEINTINEAGWPDLTISGSCTNFRAEIFGNQFFNISELNVNETLTVISNSGTLSKINGEGCKLKVELSGTGDLWYYGIPTDILKKEYNTGKLIDKN